MLFSLEGNIGCGKSTLLQRLKEINLPLDHIVLYEPVEEWLNFHPDGPDSPSIFEKYYNDKKRHGFLFQMYVLQTRINHLIRAVQENPNKIIICERTHLTDCEIFAKMLVRDNIMDAAEYYVYKSWSDHCISLLENIVKGVVYLRADVATCMTRIAKRNRNGEDNISVHYIKTLHELHDEWLLAAYGGPPVLVVNGNVEEEQVDLESIVKFITTAASQQAAVDGSNTNV